MTANATSDPGDMYAEESFEDDKGIEDEEIIGEDQIKEPFDPTLIRVEARVVLIEQILARILHNEINLTPDFQRKKNIWKIEAQSRLIESLLIRIPLPAFYMDGTDDDHWVVIDGLQRITTFQRFVKEGLKLTGLEFLTQLNGKKFQELPRNFQRRILETQLNVYLIERGTPDEVKFTIFRRINTGGLPLSAQEVRHALNQGPVTGMLTRLAESSEFKQATAGGVPDARMADREFVLRFLAFTLTPYSTFKAQDFDSFLSKTMAEINRVSEEQRIELEQQFKRAMLAASHIFGDDAFRKRYDPNARRGMLNKSLFETWSVNLSRLSDPQLEQLIARKDLVKQKFIRLLNEDRVFENAISQGTGDVAKVISRFSCIEQLIQEVLA